MHGWVPSMPVGTTSAARLARSVPVLKYVSPFPIALVCSARRGGVDVSLDVSELVEVKYRRRRDGSNV
jgi:hypothetical protein